MAGRDVLRFGFGRGGKGFADRREGVRVGGGVRARDAPDMALVNGDHLVELLPAADAVVFAGDVVGYRSVVDARPYPGY